MQLELAGQLVAHVPQLLLSLLVLRQVPWQQVWFWGQPGVFVVQHCSLAMQAFPHGLNPESQVHSVPVPLQLALTGQAPQTLPHPSFPHSLPLQFGTQKQAPSLQVDPAGQVPHEPPQPSAPHAFPLQSGRHVQTPSAQRAPPWHVPQVPPQPLSPHALPEQSGTQVTWHVPWLVQTRPPVQAPQLPPQPSSPHALPVQSATHGGGGVPVDRVTGGAVGDDWQAPAVAPLLSNFLVFSPDA